MRWVHLYRLPGHDGFVVFVRYVLISLLLFIVPLVRAEEDCSLLLASSFQSAEQPDTNKKFFAYVGGLMEEGVLGYDELARFFKGLNEGRLANPVTEEVSRKNYKAQVHQSSLQEYVDSGELDIERVRYWVLGRLEKMEYNRERREIVHEETREILIEDIFPKVRMVRLSGGHFTMGSPKTEKGRRDDEEQVEVRLSPFEIIDAQVTQEMWVEVMGNNPSRFVGLERPVESVSWNEAQEFLKRVNRQLGLTGKKGYRLPTEAEWEYAARAGTQTAYFFGDDPARLEDYAVFATKETALVRSKKPNPWELYDMYGNVWEWTMDEYDKLEGGENPLQENGIAPVIRGGAWHFIAQNLRSAFRYAFWGSGHRDIGIRVVRGL